MAGIYNFTKPPSPIGLVKQVSPSNDPKSPRCMRRYAPTPHTRAEAPFWKFRAVSRWTACANLQKPGLTASLLER